MATIVYMVMSNHRTRKMDWITGYIYHWKKLEVDLTQDGSPQLQDLGQYHLPHFSITAFLYTKLQKGMSACSYTKYICNTAQRFTIVHEYFQSSSNNV